MNSLAKMISPKAFMEKLITKMTSHTVNQLPLAMNLNHHLQGPPTNRAISIVSDKMFPPAYKVLTGRIRLNRLAGLDTATHKTAILNSDIKETV